MLRACCDKFAFPIKQRRAIALCSRNKETEIRIFALFSEILLILEEWGGRGVAGNTIVIKSPLPTPWTLLHCHSTQQGSQNNYVSLRLQRVSLWPVVWSAMAVDQLWFNILVDTRDRYHNLRVWRFSFPFPFPRPCLSLQLDMYIPSLF